MQLAITATITVADVEAPVQEASSANSKMATDPNDPTDQLQPAPAIGAVVTDQSGLRAVLERLEGLMGLADLAAEARFRCPPAL